MKTMSVKLPDSLAAWLREEAENSLRSQSEIVREALEQKRDQRGNESRRRSLADALLDLKGSVSGTHDYATNPKHFEGFGE